MTRNKGFTLVEILIVVIILGILAAIVIPQFTEASSEARQSRLDSDLQTLRSQIELYKIQHLDSQPGDTDDDGVCDDAADLVDDLTGKTTQAGAADGDLGPYLQSFPTNPLVDGDTADDVVLTSGGDGGWYFDTSTGTMYANTPAAAE